MIAVLCGLALFALWACAPVSKDERSVRETEAMLDDSGFAKVPVDVPSDDLEHLPTFTVNQYQSIYGKVYWYYDPDYCQCLYEGDQSDAERYQAALEHRNDLAQYQEDYEDEESAAQQGLMAAAFNGAVPTPFWWGGWGAWYGYGLGYHGGSGWWSGGHYHSGHGGGWGAPKPGGGGHHGIGGGGHHTGGGGWGGGHIGGGGHFGGGGGGSHGGGGGGHGR